MINAIIYSYVHIQLTIFWMLLYTYTCTCIFTLCIAASYREHYTQPFLFTEKFSYMIVITLAINWCIFHVGHSRH